MKLLTWNINGVRATKLPLKQVLDDLDADIICLQETKVTRDQLDEPTAVVPGYNAYFSFSRSKSGYSGVATYVKDAATPVQCEEGLSGCLGGQQLDEGIGCYGDHIMFSHDELLALDNEGRTIMTQHKFVDPEGKESLVTIINVYCPRADPENEQRKLFKLRFYELLQIRAEAILSSGSHVVILGDVNTSHKKIDHCDPSEDKEFYANPGRTWLSQLLVDTDPDRDLGRNADAMTALRAGMTTAKFMDTFRLFHPRQENAFTCWSTVTGARATNYGTRIDYILADVALAKRVFRDCIVMPDVHGSDHCPVRAELDCRIIPGLKCPRLCTKYLPEFAGMQQKLSDFFSKRRELPSSETNRSGDIGPVGSTPTEMSRSASQGHPSGSKRPLDKKTSDCGKSTSKKARLREKQGSGSSGKQGTLFAFIKQPSYLTRDQCQDDVKTTTDASLDNDLSRDRSLNADAALNPTRGSVDKERGSADAAPVTSQVPGGATGGSTPGRPGALSSRWRSLLKGPPTAPPCRGHKEPCLLRTVKKEGQNKGRQFWVCCRPEGHKTNREARCDHFEWIVKKKS